MLAREIAYSDGTTSLTGVSITVREIKAFRADCARITRRVKAGLDVLASDAQMDGRAAVVGYCFGGLAALELARSGIELAAIVSMHGTLSTTQPVEAGMIRTPILVCQGALDPHCSLADAIRFADEMRSLSAIYAFLVRSFALASDSIRQKQR